MIPTITSGRKRKTNNNNRARKRPFEVINVLITATDYAKKKKVDKQMLMRIIKYLQIKPEQTIGNALMFPEELFDRIVEAINNIPLDKKT